MAKQQTSPAQNSSEQAIYSDLSPSQGKECKPANINKDRSHANEPISHENELTGRSRAGGDVDPEIRRKIIDLTIDEATRRGHSFRDIAHILLIVKRESSFNPDASNCDSSASGLGQIMDITAEDLKIFTAAPAWKKKNPQDYNLDLTRIENRFDARKNIIGTIITFERSKARAIQREKISDRFTVEELIYQYYHKGLYFDALRGPNGKKDGNKIDPNIDDNFGKAAFDNDIKPLLSLIERDLQAKGKVKVQLVQPDSKPAAKQQYIAVVPKKPTASTKERFFGWIRSLWSSDEDAPPPKPVATATPKPPIQSATAVGAVKVATVAATPTVNTNTFKYPGRTMDMSLYDIYMGETNANGETEEIPVNGTSEILFCLMPLDYDAKAKQLSKQDEENLEQPSANVKAEGESPTSASAPSSTNTSAESIQSIEPAISEPKLDAGVDATDSPSHEQQHTVVEPDPTKWEKLYCNRRATSKIWETAFERAQKPYRPELIAFDRSFIVKPMIVFDRLELKTANSHGPVQIEQISTNVKKDQVKEEKKPIAKVTTAANNPAAIVTASALTPWMDIAFKERNQQEVAGSPEKSSEVIEARKKIKDAAVEQKQVKTALKKAQKIKKGQTQDADEITKLQKRLNELQKIIIEQDKIADQATRNPKINNPRIIEYIATTEFGKGKLANHESIDDESLPWCASFANWCLIKAGYSTTNSAASDGWVNYGTEAKVGQYGAVVVIAFGKQHHTAFIYREGTKKVKGKDVPFIEMLGGNQSYDKDDKQSPSLSRVSLSSVNNPEILARRWPVK